jgi:hypothetical protein
VRISLSEWETFYVITGSSAAALTGIMFVVVALVADRVVRRPSDGVGAFSTPTIAHFALVLLLASIMTIPGHGVLSLSICIGGLAIIGLTSSGLAGVRMQRVKGYTPETVDWAWHVIIPFAAYLVLLVSAFLLGTQQELALVVVAVTVLALIFIGIHNAWDVAVYIVTQGVPEANAREATAVPPPPTPAPVATPAAARSDAPGSLSPS